MVVGLGRAGLLPQRPSKHSTRAGSGSGGNASIHPGVSSSSQRASLAMGTGSEPRNGTPHSLAQPSTAAAQQSPLLGPILQASLAHLASDAQGGGQQAQQATRSGSSVAVGGSVPAALAVPAAAEPASAEFEDCPPGGPSTSAAAAAAAATGAAGSQPPAAQHIPGKVGQQAAFKRKLRAAQQQRQQQQSSQLGARAAAATDSGGVAAGPQQQQQQQQEGGGQQVQGDTEMGEAMPQDAARAPGAGDQQGGPAAAAHAGEVLSQPQPLAEAAEGKGEAGGSQPAAAQQAAPVRQQQQQQRGKRGHGRGRAAAAAAGQRQEEVQAEGTAGRGAGGAGSARGGAKREAATPGGRRGKQKRRRITGGHPTPSKYADLVGRTVEVPASLFSVDVPDLYYRGVVTKKESGRKTDAMEVRFLDDGSKYWFPTPEIRRWLAGMEARGAAKGADGGISVGRATDEFAAEVLTDIASGGSQRTGRGASQLSDAAVHALGTQGEAGQPAGAAGGPPAADGAAEVPGPAVRENGGDDGEADSSRHGGRGPKAQGQGQVQSQGRAKGRAGGSRGGETASLHVIAEAAGMNLLSPPRQGPTDA